MQRRRFVTTAALGSAAVLPSPAIAQSAPEIAWRLASSFPRTVTTLNGAAEYLCTRVAAATDNRFQIRPFPADEIAPAAGVLDAVQAGTVEMGHTSFAFLADKNPALAFGTALPFGLTSRQQMAWICCGGGLELVGELLKAAGCLGIPAGNTGAQMGGWFRKEIKAPEDFKGLKIRLIGLGAAVAARMGALPQPLAANDLVAALDKGSIGAAAYGGPADDDKLGLVRAAKFYYYPGWASGNSMLWSLVNLDKWRDLPASYKAVLELACYDTCSWVQARYDSDNPPALRRLIAAGAQLRPFPREVAQAAYKASFELYAEARLEDPGVQDAV